MRRMTRLVTWSLLAALVLTPVWPVRAQQVSPNLTGVLGPGGMIWYSAASQIVSNTTAATALFSGTIPAAQALTVNLPDKVQLGNNGGLISLLDKGGLKVDGVSYTRDQVASGHGTVTF